MISNRPAPGRVALVGFAALFAGGCLDSLGPGEHGLLRYFGEVRGEAPLQMVPPMLDREGNAYVLFGSPDLATEAEAFVGHVNGGWSSGCSIIDSDDSIGARGWVGRATSRGWYWAGAALVEVQGRTGGCRVVLDRDPASNADLYFRGVIPQVHETPSRTYLNAFVQTQSAQAPYLVTVDLDNERYYAAQGFEPSEATDVQVLGVGADRDTDTGFAVVKYTVAGAPAVEGLFINRDGNVIARSQVDVPGEVMSQLGAGSVLGFLQSPNANLVAGFLSTGDVIMFDRAAGVIRSVPGMTAAGVHQWNGNLYVVGTNAVDPVISRITSGAEFATPVLWEASARTAERLKGTVRVVDDRTDPKRQIGWQDPRTALADPPFVQPFSPNRYADDSTGWLVAGPGFQVSGDLFQTSVAFGPIGISYP